MRKYSWKNYVFSQDSQKVGEELEELEKVLEITNKNVLEYARKNKDSELHKCFEWNDTIAGEKYRLIQATNVISSISFVIEEEPIKKQKVYFSVKSDAKENRQFKNIKDILEDDEDYKALLNKARKEFETCKDNYDSLIKREDLKDIIFDIYREI